MAKTYEERLNELERYQLRDIDTKKVKLSFKGYYSAVNYWLRMNFGLNRFYEIYDTKRKKVLRNDKD